MEKEKQLKRARKQLLIEVQGKASNREVRRLKLIINQLEQ